MSGPLGLASYYRRYIPEFLKVAAPLFSLSRKDALFVWTDACQRAFMEVKSLLINALVLAFLGSALEQFCRRSSLMG